MGKNRNRSYAPRTAAPGPAAVKTPVPGYVLKEEGINRVTLLAVDYMDYQEGIDFGGGKGPGRPSGTGYAQQSAPPIDVWSSRLPGDYKQYPERIFRQRFPSSTMENLQLNDVDPYRAMRALPRLSSIVGQSLRLLKRLANSDIIVSVKNQDAEGRWTVEDNEAVDLGNALMRQAGMHVVSRIPGAYGNSRLWADDQLTKGFVFGKMANELVLKKNRRDFSHMAVIEPNTIEYHRDTNNVGAMHIGQRRSDIPEGWLKLNPDLVTCVPINGHGLGNIYGEPEFLTAFHVAPIWQGYFGKLAIFIQRAAFGFLDGVVKVEILQDMWQKVSEANRNIYRNDFMVWANAMVRFLADSYKKMGEADPDALLAHLDILEIDGKVSGGAKFPTTDAAEVVRTEMYNAIGAPGELFGEKSTPSDRFTDLKIEAYYCLLKHYQDSELHLVNRAIEAACLAKGWPRRIKAECRFNPIRIYDRLTLAQAEQIEGLVYKFRRDEGLISQDEMAYDTVGHAPVAQHPLAKSPDTSGDSTPDKQYMGVGVPTDEQVALNKAAQDQAAKDKVAAAGGPAEAGKGAKPTGGANKKRQTDPTKDKKLETSEFVRLSSLRPGERMAFLPSFPEYGTGGRKEG